MERSERSPSDQFFETLFGAPVRPANVTRDARAVRVGDDRLRMRSDRGDDSILVGEIVFREKSADLAVGRGEDGGRIPAGAFPNGGERAIDVEAGILLRRDAVETLDHV